MNLYDIDNAIAALIDPETGEIEDFEAFENLEISRERKIEFLCKSIKEAPVLTEAIQSEISRLQEKKKSIEARAGRNKAYLQGYLAGEKYKSPLFSCYYGTTKEVQGSEEDFKEWAMQQGADEYLKYKEPELDRTSIKKALANGVEIPHLTLVDKKYLCIK